MPAVKKTTKAPAAINVPTTVKAPATKKPAVKKAPVAKKPAATKAAPAPVVKAPVAKPAPKKVVKKAPVNLATADAHIGVLVSDNKADFASSTQQLHVVNFSAGEAQVGKTKYFTFSADRKRGMTTERKLAAVVKLLLADLPKGTSVDTVSIVRNSDLVQVTYRFPVK